MPKTLDEALQEVWRWRDAVQTKLAGLAGPDRDAFWKNAIEEAGELLGRPLTLRPHVARGRRAKHKR